MGDSMSQLENRDSPTVLLRRLHRWRMAFFGLIILIAGLTTGAAATLLVLHATGPRRPGPADRGYQMVLEQIMPRLHLSPEQAGRVGPILRKYMQRLEEIREQGRLQITRELQAMDAEMSGVLNPDQQQRWQDLLRGLPGQFPRGPGRYGPGPKGPGGPRGGGPGRLRKSVESPLPSPNDAAPRN
jgi:hypothetical protein